MGCLLECFSWAPCRSSQRSSRRNNSDQEDLPQVLRPSTKEVRQCATEDSIRVKQEVPWQKVRSSERERERGDRHPARRASSCLAFFYGFSFLFFSFFFLFCFGMSAGTIYLDRIAVCLACFYLWCLSSVFSLCVCIFPGSCCRWLNRMRGDRFLQVLLLAYTEAFPNPADYPEHLLFTPMQMFQFCGLQTLLRTQVSPYLHNLSKGRAFIMQMKAAPVPSPTHRRTSMMMMMIRSIFSLEMSLTLSSYSNSLSSASCVYWALIYP